MQKSHRVTAVLAAALISSAAFSAPQQGAYLAVKFNRVFIADLSGSEEEFGANFGAGYSFGVFALEYEHARYNATIERFFNPDIDVEIDTDAFYAVARSSGDWYVKAKAGILREEVEGSGGGVTAEGDDTGASVGFGFGYQQPEFRFEVEATRVEQDVSALSVGFNFLF